MGEFNVTRISDKVQLRAFLQEHLKDIQAMERNYLVGVITEEDFLSIARRLPKRSTFRLLRYSLLGRS